MVHVCATDRDKLSDKAVAWKTVKRMTESERTEHTKAHIKLYPQGRI